MATTAAMMLMVFCSEEVRATIHAQHTAALCRGGSCRWWEAAAAAAAAAEAEAALRTQSAQLPNILNRVSVYELTKMMRHHPSSVDFKVNCTSVSNSCGLGGVV